MGFDDGYPLVVVFYRGFYCPRDGVQLRQLVRFQEELSVNYCRLVAISVDSPMVSAAFRYGLGASFPFLSDENREAIDHLGIRDETEAEYPGCAIPTTFVLNPDLRIYKTYDGWFFVGRPTLEELRQDLRAILTSQKRYSYESWNTEAIKRSLRIPAERWEHGAPPLGAGGDPTGRGTVQWFSIDDGYGMIVSDDGRQVFVHFSAIPGEGYRTVHPGAVVEYEEVPSPTGFPCAVNVRVVKESDWGPGSLKSSIVSGLNL
jgi:cold shock CspA family protein/peroxiredoxin